MTIDHLPLGEAPSISTARLGLRAPTLADAPAIAYLANDPDVARRMARLPSPYGLDDALFYVREIVPTEIAWAITLADDGTLIGIVGLVPTSDPDVLELGYWLGQNYWERGFATEAAGAIVAYAFDDLGLAKLVSGCFVDNAASRRVLRKIGFADCGRSERHCLMLASDLPFINMELERTS